jgi:hypothetical protein
MLLADVPLLLYVPFNLQCLDNAGTFLSCALTYEIGLLLPLVCQVGLNTLVFCVDISMGVAFWLAFGRIQVSAQKWRTEEDSVSGPNAAHLFTYEIRTNWDL